MKEVRMGPTRSEIAERFLEPVYMNDAMVLNCASYLFGGSPVEATTTATSGKTREVSGNASLPWFSGALGIGAKLGKSQSIEQKSIRRTELGGLHMDVVNGLRTKKMLATIKDKSDSDIQAALILDRYVELEVSLRPTSYFGLLELMSNFGPMAIELAGPLFHLLDAQAQKSAEKLKIQQEQLAGFLSNLTKNAEPVMSTIRRLERDYLASGQLEMVMVLPDGREIGIVDLDLADMDAKQLKTRLSGGTYHVFGKVTSAFKSTQQMNLLQKTMMSDAIDLYQRLPKQDRNVPSAPAPQSATDNPGSVKGQGFEMLGTNNRPGGQTSSVVTDAASSTSEVIDQINKVIAITMPGPAVRISGMSVCI